MGNRKDGTAQDYSNTLMLPKTGFPMRAQLPQREPEFIERWQQQRLYEQLREQRKGNEVFILHDGPPYANGDIHIGTALNKILKDFVIRYKSMRGFDAPFVPGWDTHGLPIEVKTIEALNIDRHAIDVMRLREACREFALSWRDRQREQFIRLGGLGDWDNPYLTLLPEYEAAQIRVFGEMAKQGHIYRDLYPVYWCTTCETALAEAEIEFREKRSPSIYVAFPVTDGKGVVPADCAALIWTTTPWTLPANAAIAVHPDVRYVAVDTDRGTYLIAADLQDRLTETIGWEVRGVRGAWPGRELQGIVCRHPWEDRPSPLVLGEHVTVEEGTGLVHTAPGHGPEDFEMGRRWGLPVIQPLSDQGVFNEDAGRFAGQPYERATTAIVEHLRGLGLLLYDETITHQYAHCWRCKNPVVWRATAQWFASIDGFREKALKAIEAVTWIPSWGQQRIYNMVAERKAWCISRQRHWGVPLPVFYCEDCETPLINDTTIEAVASLFAQEGSDAWWRYDAGAILPAGTTCPECGGSRFRKETDTMDVWFDSGSSHAAVLTQREGLRWPADLYLEGSDQHRGWFQSSLLTAVATRGQAPYRAVLTHGFVVDGEGRKMSKSLGNTIAPQDIIKQYGADILRLWVASSDYRQDIRISPEIIAQLVEIYRKIRNTLRFMLGNLQDFEPGKHDVAYDALLPIDRWILKRLCDVIEQATAGYDAYSYHVVYQQIHNYCTVDLSSLYLDVSKDRLYAEAPDSPSRRAVQTVLLHVVRALVRLLAPLLPFTAEDAWGHLPDGAERLPSVHLALWPEIDPAWRDDALADVWPVLLDVRDEIARAVEQRRQDGTLRDAASAAVAVQVDDPALRTLLAAHRDTLQHIARVAELTLVDQAPAGAITGLQIPGLVMHVERTQFAKCERCWRHLPDVGVRPEAPDVCGRCADVLASAPKQA